MTPSYGMYIQSELYFGELCAWGIDNLDRMMEIPCAKFRVWYHFVCQDINRRHR